MTSLHVALRTCDPARMVEFYSKIVGLSVVQTVEADDKSFSIYFLSDTELPVLEIIHNRGQEKIEKGNLLSHYGLFLPNFDAVMEALKAGGIEIVEENLVQGRRQVYVRDPDGNFVELNEMPAG